MGHFVNPLFRLRLSLTEYHPFMSMLPLAEITASKSEKSEALKIIGVGNKLIYKLLSHHDHDLVTAFRVVLFAMSLKEFPIELKAFLTRINFVDKSFEKRFREMLGEVFDSRKIISVKELNAMWELESTCDDGGYPIDEY